MSDDAAEAMTLPPGTAPQSKAALQLKKLTEANAKYKNLLKLAKERITKQEEELEILKQGKNAVEDRIPAEERDAAGQISMEDTYDRAEAGPSNIVRVIQRIKLPLGHDHEEIWALMELETQSNDTMDSTTQTKRFKEWKRFDTEAELQDFIRRDTGEPIQLPPYSFSPEQSAKIKRDAEQKVSEITEEFRRFRVRAELARKQADAQIRDLQSNNLQKAAQRIESSERYNESDRSNGPQLERLRAELAAQEAHWKEAYDILLTENEALKSTGSEALLASQWRQRYEQCRREKDELESKIKVEQVKSEEGDARKYEQKYRDLKESFRIYRKKAKEMFESQNHGNQSAPMSFLGATEGSTSAEAKLSYLKNLMVNYLSSDATVRDHTESAIATVLQFTPEEIQRIEKKKAEHDSWF